MKKILLLIILITVALGQFTNEIAGWSKGAFYVPDGTIYSEGLIVADETVLASESLNEVDFATHAKWDVTNDFDDTNGNASYIWSANQTSTLTQIQANLAIAGVDAVWYQFTYTVTIATAFDGDGTATITTAFASSAISLDLSIGTHSVYFKSKTTPTDFIISVVSGSDTEGMFEIDDVTLKQITGGNVNISGTLLIRGVDIGAGIGASTDDQKIDVFSVSGDNVQLSLEDDGEATKTVDISTTTAVVANTSKITTQWTTDGNDIYYNTGKVGAGTPTPNAPLEVKGASPGVVGGFQSGHLQVTGSSAAQYANAVITGHSAYNTNTQLWYLGSTSTSNNDVGFHNRQNGSMHFNTNNTRKMEIAANGDVSIGESIDDVQPTFSIIGDADSDAADVSETFSFTIVPNANPLLAYIGFTLGQGLGYNFDKQITIPKIIVTGGTPGVGKVLQDDGAGTGIAAWTTPSAGGDFSDGGEVGGADRTLGNTDAFALGFETNNVERAQFSAAGHFLPIGTHTYDLGSAAADWNNAYIGIGYIGTLYADGGIWHTGDVDTKIAFTTDKVEHYAGDVKFIELVEAVADYVSIGESADIDIYFNWMDYNYGNSLTTFKAKKTVFAPNISSLTGTSVADDGAISVTAYVMRVVGADADALLDTDPAINDGSADGQIVIIQGVADGNTVTIADNVNTQLNGAASCTLGDGDTISLLWDSDYSMWIELYRSNN